MGSQEGGGSDSKTAAVVKTRIDDPLSTTLAQQGSLYGLTFDEVQNQIGDLGKPLTTMNLDELLKTVWTVETGNQVVGPGPADDGPDPDQHSDVVVPPDLIKKTVDEVWHDIRQQGQKRNFRKATLGEMTLEDFLVKAGVVAQPTKNLGPAQGVMPQQAQWAMNYQPIFLPGHHTRPTQPMPDGASYPESRMAMSASPLTGDLSDTQSPGRKRVASYDISEKSIERRHKRMIKNRESAARSRARKQAYTHELESKILRLEEENDWLKRQKEIEKVLPSIPPPEPKYQLRRTSSSPM